MSLTGIFTLTTIRSFKVTVTVQEETTFKLNCKFKISFTEDNTTEHKCQTETFILGDFPFYETSLTIPDILSMY